ISIIRSVSGLSPVISKSIQIRLLCLSVIISSAYCTSALCVILARLITYSEPHYPAAVGHCYIATHVIILFHSVSPISGPSTVNMSKRHLNRRQRWRIEKIQQERLQRPAKNLARNEADVAADLDEPQHGTVVAHYGQKVEIESADGIRQRCHFRANLIHMV